MVRDLTQGGAGWRWWSGGPGRARPGRWGWPGRRSSWTAIRSSAPPPTGIATVGWPTKASPMPARSTGCCSTSARAGRAGRPVGAGGGRGRHGRTASSPLGHAERAGAKVVLVGDDRQFASIAAGGGFRALRLRLGASELTVNRRQVEAWEQRAIDDVRAGNLEQAIAAYAEHDRIRAFEARDDRDRALVADWWQAHEAGERR